MPERMTVDRIEDGLAVCEGPDRQMRALPLEMLPEGVREGDCLIEEDGRYLLDPEETQSRRAANLALLRELMERDDDG